MGTRSLGFPSIKEKMDRFMLGYVVDPLPGHEMYKGMLAIPYLRWSQEHGWAVVAIRFRCIEDHSCKALRHGKYQTMPGDRPRLYNTMALLETSPIIAITEGEIDAITASVCGIPTVGVPGATSWQQHFREPFLGYREVFILADGDEPGLDFAKGIAKSLPNGKVIPCPPGEDVNSLVSKQGPKALMERIS
ncbi:toprim domain-containing protein [Nocardia sp. NPDC055002]